MPSVTLERTALEIAVKNSLDVWQSDLKHLVEHAKDRFPDVIWESLVSTEGSGARMESIWGHKDLSEAIIYARTSPKYQALHLYAGNDISYSELPYASISSIKDLDHPASSKLTLEPSVFLGSSGMVHLKIPQHPDILIRNLRKIYVSSDNHKDVAYGGSQNLSSRLNALQKDLLFAWSTRLSSDIRLQVALAPKETGEVDTQNGVHIFWSHRFILASRSPYFLVELERLAESEENSTVSNNVQVLVLPSSHFMLDSLFFTLGYIYTGTLDCFNITYTLEQAFAIYKSAKFLKMSNLLIEIRAHIAEIFLHGLFNSALPQEEYESFLIERKWHRMVELGGCICEQCTARLARILEFSLSLEVDDAMLGRGARRAAVGMFGEGWCSRGFAQLPEHICKIVLDDVKDFITPDNFFRLLFASEKGLRRLTNMRTIWRDAAKTLLITVRDMVDGLLFAQPKLCFECEEWMEIMRAERVKGTGDIRAYREETKWIFDAISRVFCKGDAQELSGTLVSSVLLRPDPVDNETLFLPHSSYIRTQVKGLLNQSLPSSIDLPKLSDSSNTTSTGRRDDSSSALTLSSVSVGRSRASSTSSPSTKTGKYHRQSISMIADANDDHSVQLGSVPGSNKISIFSYPTSRTTSTYYGFYYTRRALSSVEGDQQDNQRHDLGA